MTAASQADPAETKPFADAAGRGWYRGPLAAEEAARQVRGWLDEVRAGRGQIVHDGNNRVVALDVDPAAGECRVAVKLFPPPQGLRRLQQPFRAGKARRAFLTGERLCRHGLATPRPLACIEEPDGRSALVTAWLPDAVPLRTILRGRDSRFPDGPTPGFIDQLAAAVRALHDAGVVHRDLSDGNVLVYGQDGEWRFSLIDLNRARIRRHCGRLAGLRDVIRLGIPKPLRRQFIDAYWRGPAPAWAHCAYRLMKWRFELWLSVKKSLGLKKLARLLKL